MAKHYYISFDGVGYTEIFPVNNPIATKRPLEGTQVWREEVDEIKLTKTKNSSIYDTLHSYFIDKTKFDTEIEIEIYEGIRTTGVLYWQGLFSISDTTDNFEYDTASLNPLRINDDYRTIIEKADIAYELDARLVTILETKRVGYAQAVSIATTWINGTPGGVSNFATLTAVGGTITSIVADAAQGGYLPIDEALDTNDDIVIVDFSAYTKAAGTDPTMDIQYGAADTSMTDEGAKSIGTGTHAFSINTGQASPRLVFFAGSCTVSGTFTVRKVPAAYDELTGGELLMTFIENFVDSSKQMHLTGYTGNVLSTFFDNDALPTGAPSSIATFMAANPNGNYVTETATNELNTTVIGLMRKWFGNAPESFKLSFNEIMSQLREMFQVYWFIDADDKLRIEHQKYFDKQLEDSTPLDITGKTLSEIDAREMVYNKQRISTVEQFSWAQSGNLDFVGEDIDYNNFETTNISYEHAVNYVTTDLQYVIDNISDASSSGFGIYHCNLLTGISSGGGLDMYEITISTGDLSSAAISNAAFSWANIHNRYWSWSRMSENATINSVATTMNSAVRFLEQAGVNFLYSTALDPYTTITTTLTGGAPIEIRRNLETDYIELILGFDPYKL